MDFSEVVRTAAALYGLMPKLRAMVSKFPVLEANMASSTNATAISPFHFVRKLMRE